MGLGSLGGGLGAIGGLGDLGGALGGLPGICLSCVFLNIKDCVTGFDDYLFIKNTEKLIKWLTNDRTDQGWLPVYIVVTLVSFIAFRVPFAIFLILILVIAKIIKVIVTNIHNFVYLLAIAAFAFAIYLIFYLWGLIRKGINEKVIPGLNEGVQGVASVFNDAIRPINKYFKAGIDEMPTKAIEGEFPRLWTIVKFLSKPLVDAILKPLRADN